MKKVLLGATALTAAGTIAAVATPAQAEFDMSISGWNTNIMVYSDSDAENVADGTTVSDRVDNNASGASMYNNSELNFFASQKLDNGLTITSRIELNTNNGDAGNIADETQVFIDGGFGQIQVGGINAANDSMHYGAPNASLSFGLNASTHLTYLGINGAGAGAGSFQDTTNHLGTDKTLGIGYYTPRIAGFQAGATYFPNAQRGNGAGAFDGGDRNAVLAGVNFQSEMSGVGLKASVGGGMIGKTSTNDDDDNAVGQPDEQTLNWGVGADYMGFSLGFDMGMTMAGDDDYGSGTGDRSRTWTIGAKYGQGPWSVSYGYMQSKAVGNDGDSDTQDKGSFHLIAGSYSMGPGVDLGLDVAMGSVETEEPENDAAAFDSSGVSVAAGINVSF